MLSQNATNTLGAPAGLEPATVSLGPSCSSTELRGHETGCDGRTRTTITRVRAERPAIERRRNNLVSSVGFEPTSSRLEGERDRPLRHDELRTGRPGETRNSCDNVERTARIELASPDWRPGASPFGHVRSIWYPRQDSNLHDSAFVARRLSIQLHAGTFRSGAGEEIRTPIFSLEG